MQIKIPYNPRSLQRELHQKLHKKRWGVVVCHRRWGKTVMAINHLLRDAILNDKPNPRFAYIAPTYRQAKAVAWDYLKQFSSAIPMVRFNETELRCDLPNGARIQLLGSESPDSLRGLYLDGCILDEYSQILPSMFPEVIRPALSDRKGYAIFMGTPQGMNNFYEVYEAAKTDKDWVTAVYKASETGILDEEELDSARKSMSEDQFNQEYECSWVANVPGAIFAKEIEKAANANRITNVPYDAGHKVDTWWDLGVNDSTAIWFTQNVGRAVHVIDYYENRGEGLNFYARILQERGYLYGTHNAPHDIEVRELGSGKSRREAAYDLGINFRVVPKLPIEDGIHAAKMIIGKCWFDKDQTKVGMEALRHYHRAYNERMRTFRSTPVHNWASHGSDAWRTFGVGHRENLNTVRPPQRQAEMVYNPFEARL
jgi:phage terminase large subunit|tara:strand:+ start:738 stop:2018 length:1281 start_codon:yes stop_codon:yes gene_type:complete